MLLTLLWSGLFTWLVGVLLTAWVLLRPARMTPARALARLGFMTPGDLGISFEQQDLPITDARTGRALRLAGWWMPAPGGADSSVILIHGYADSRAGVMPWAAAFLRAGVNVLAIDLRAHGESEGAFTSAGLLEGDDVRQVVGQLRDQRPDASRHLFLAGVSMGAAVALAAADGMDDLAGVILDSPVADFYRGAERQLWLMGLAGPVVLKPGLWLVEAWLGRRFNEIRPARLVARRKCPVLAILPGSDLFLPPEDAEALSRAIERPPEGNGLATGDDPSTVLPYPGTFHMQPIGFDPEGYTQALQRFCAACKCNGLARAPVSAGPPTAPAAEPASCDVEIDPPAVGREL